MKKYIVLLLIVIIFCDCRKNCEAEHDNCTHEELSWLVWYVGETVIFKRNDGVFDTAKASPRNYYDIQLSTESMDGRQCASYAQTVSQYLSGKIINVGIEAWAMTSQGPRIFFGNYDYYNALVLNVTPQNNITVNGIIYNNVYMPHFDTTDLALLTTSEPWRAYFTKSDGIIRMDYTKGYYWEKIN